MPAPRPRCTSRGGRFATPYNPREYTQWKEQAAKLLGDVVPEPFGERLGDFRISLVVQTAKPKTTKLSRPKPDVDNYAKGILDAITQSERVWDDDYQVASLTVTKRWAPDGEQPGVHITITPYLDEDQ